MKKTPLPLPFCMRNQNECIKRRMGHCSCKDPFFESCEIGCSKLIRLAANNNYNEGAPTAFICLLSRKVMMQPVVINGHSFEKDVWINYFYSDGGHICPVTGMVYKRCEHGRKCYCELLFDNNALRQALIAWWQQFLNNTREIRLKHGRALREFAEPHINSPE